MNEQEGKKGKWDNMSVISHFTFFPGLRGSLFRDHFQTTCLYLDLFRKKEENNINATLIFSSFSPSEMLQRKN